MRISPFSLLYDYCDKIDLQDMLEKRGLRVSGTKEELVRRFLRDWKKEGRNNYDLLMFLDYVRLAVTG